MVKKMPSLHHCLLLSALCALLSACAVPRQMPTSDFKQLQRQLQAVDSWRVTGKIGLRQNGRGNSAQVNWQQAQDQYTLRLSGPLGIGTVMVEGDASGVTVHNKDGVFEAPSPEQLLLDLTGWQIPITALRYWARGLPAPDMPIVQQQIDQGRLASLNQGGWNIEYRDYTMVDGLWLPAKMLMSRPETQLTLLYKTWQLGPQ
jgi:outer membrane lipoprotein LolB